jgi:hypothetical protein
MVRAKQESRILWTRTRVFGLRWFLALNRNSYVTANQHHITSYKYTCTHKVYLNPEDNTVPYGRIGGTYAPPFLATPTTCY